MDNFETRRPAARQNRIGSRVLAAATLALALIAGVASAQAHPPASASTGGILGTGGVSGGGGVATGTGETSAPGCPDTELGRRTLKVGDCGGDVATLNWILKAKDYGRPPLADKFEDPTEQAVREFQANAQLSTNGVVSPTTAAALVNSMPEQLATWYGPGLFGNQTACGQTLTRKTMGVAHKTLPCGSKVVIRYHGRFVRTTVIDRGPFANGASWDLTQATARALHFEYTDEIRVAKFAAQSASPQPG
jgi:hypothetical protein